MRHDVVAVVGGGLYGLSVAVHARRWARRVVVLDDEQGGASAAAIGHVLPGNPAETYGALVRGRPWLMERLDRRPHVALAPDVATLEAFRAETAGRVLRRPPVVVGVEEATRRFGTALGPEVTGVRVQEDAYLVSPRGLLHGLRNQLYDVGGTLRSAAVSSVEVGPTGVDLVLDDGVLHADVVIVAAGIRTAELLPELADHVTPTPALVVRTAPVEARIGFLGGVGFGSLYFHQQATGELVVGGGVGRLDDLGSPASLDRPVTALRRFLPDLPAVEVVESWTGEVDGTRDGRPLLGWVRPHAVAVVAGFNGHGIPGSNEYARRTVDHVLAGVPDRVVDQCSPTRVVPTETS